MQATSVMASPSVPASLIKAKIHPPRPRNDEVARTRTIRSIASARDARVVSIAAPPGYGKTTVLAQLARTMDRPTAWLTIDAADNDVVGLFSYLAAAVDRVAPIDQDLVGTLRAPGLPPYALARVLLTAFLSAGQDVSIVLDDVHLLTDYSCLDALTALIDGLPEGWQIAIAGRTQPNLHIGRWRSEGVLLELGMDDLSLDERECHHLARALDIELTADDIHQLATRFEGWSAGLYLAISAMKRSGKAQASSLPASDEPYLADYLRSEVLNGIDPDLLTFLRQTSFLERPSPSLCDAVIGTDESAPKLETLTNVTSLVVRLGGGRGWYRYHTLLREYLFAEFERLDPTVIAESHRRAGRWYAENGLAENAVVELLSAGDVDQAAALFGSVIFDLFYTGRAATVRTFGDRFADEELGRNPWLATWLGWAALYAAQVGRVARMADITDGASFSGTPPDGTASFESGRAMLNVFLARAGTDGMRAQADLVIAAEPTWSPWRPLALQCGAIASLASGDDARAERELAETADVARAASASGEEQGALALLALLAINKGDWDRAASLTDESVRIMRASHLESYIASAMTHPASARVAVHRGDLPSARASLASAQLLRPILTHAMPWYSVRSLLEIARAYLAMSDAEGARAILAQAEDVMRKRPDIGPVAGDVRAMREAIRDLPVALTGSSGLTATELRVLAYLPFHLSYREIADRLGVKESTVKTHTVSIYGKFGVSSRAGAIHIASTVGLIAGIPS